MPPGYTLYVKENKTQMGSRSFHFLEEIRKIPNVKFISPKEDTFKLIENCSLLVTITGTAGFEAILFNKPVITFGDVYFNEYSHTTKIRDLDLLSKTIRDKIFNKEKSPERDIQLFVQAILNSSYEGLIRAPADCNNYSLKKDNVKLLAKGVISKLK